MSYANWALVKITITNLWFSKDLFANLVTYQSETFAFTSLEAAFEIIRYTQLVE